MAITAAMVKVLREKTGVGMMDCKKALVECDGNEEKAIAYLREKGLAKAAKKVGRATTEGVVGAYMSEDGRLAAMVELMCETDFVAKNDEFQAFASSLAKQVAIQDKAEGTGEDLGDQPELTALIAKLGENMQVGRFARIEADGIGMYIHSNGKIGAFVPAQGAASQAVLLDVAMQVAAMSPLYAVPEDVPADVLEKEKDIFRNQALEEGKPADIAEKIILGRVNKYYKEVCLLEQAFFKDEKLSIKQYLKQEAPEVTVTSFVRFALGEGQAEAQAEEV